MWSACLVLYTSTVSKGSRWMLEVWRWNHWAAFLQARRHQQCSKVKCHSIQLCWTNSIVWSLADVGTRWQRSSWFIRTLNLTMEMRENKGRLDLWENFILAFHDTPTPNSTHSSSHPNKSEIQHSQVDVHSTTSNCSAFTGHPRSPLPCRRQPRALPPSRKCSTWNTMQHNQHINHFL